MTPDISDAKLIQIKRYVQKCQPQIGLLQIIDTILDNWPNNQASQEFLNEATAKTIGDWIIETIEWKTYEKELSSKSYR